MNKKDQKLNLPSEEQKKKFFIEHQKTIRQVDEYFNHYLELRYSVWNIIIQFNAILIGAFSVVITINKNLDNIHYFAFYVIAFVPIILTAWNYIELRKNIHMALQISVNKMKLSLPELKVVEYILEKNDPNYKPKHNKNKNETRKPDKKAFSTEEKIAFAFSLVAFAYFIWAIYINIINISKSKPEQIIVNGFF